MKVLSLLQPWASLVVLGLKTFEVRGWKTNYRGPLLIHASAKKPSRREKLFFENADYFSKYIINMDLLPYGSIIGKTELYEIFQTDWLVQNPDVIKGHNWEMEFSFDDFGQARFAWHLRNAAELKKYLPLKGSLGLWEYNGELGEFYNESD